MPSIARTAIVVNQAIRTGSCGNSQLKQELESRRESIAAIFCSQTGEASAFSDRELYLRILMEVLKVALARSAKLIDFTEVREDANRNMDSRTLSNRDSEGKETRSGEIVTEMSFCSYRDWDRHRVGSDSSNSTAISKSRNNSYSHYRDTSANKSASAEEGLSENELRSEMGQLGQGTADGTRNSSQVSHIKPKADSEGGHTPIPAEIDATLASCGRSLSEIDWISKAGVLELLDCIQSACDFVGGDGEDSLGKSYSAEHIKTNSGFSASPASGIVGTNSDPICSINLLDDLCDTASGSAGNSWNLKKSELPETYSNSYHGNLTFEFSMGISLLGTGVGFSARFSLQAGEAFSQSAKIDQGYSFSSTHAVYCSDGGTLSAQKGITENIAESASQTKNDKHRRAEKASEAGSSLNASSAGLMKFSGKSSTKSDRTFSRIGTTVVARTVSMTENSTAKLADISGMKMRSITEYRHQVSKMIEDLIKKTAAELEAVYINKGRGQSVQAEAPNLQIRCNTPMGKLGTRYVRPTLRGAYPLFPANGKF